MPAVVQLLASPCEEVQRQAAGVLLNLSDAKSKRVQQACGRAGAVAALLQLLRSDHASAESRLDAATALRQLCSCQAAHRQAFMAQPGSIGILNRLLLDVAASPDTAMAAIGTLRHLTFDDQAAAVIPTIPVVVQCLRSPEVELVIQAASLLVDVARYSADARQAIVSAGGIAALAAVMHSSAPMTPLCTAASAALKAVALGNRQVAAAVVQAMGMRGSPCAEALVELFTTCQHLPPEAIGLPAGLQLPGLSNIGLPLEAAGYRWVQ